jgi:hypothetical protein
VFPQVFFAHHTVPSKRRRVRRVGQFDCGQEAFAHGDVINLHKNSFRQFENSAVYDYRSAFYAYDSGKTAAKTAIINT